MICHGVDEERSGAGAHASDACSSHVIFIRYELALNCKLHNAAGMKANQSITPQSSLGRSYMSFRSIMLRSTPTMGFVELEVLDALERLAKKAVKHQLVQFHLDLSARLKDPNLMCSDELRSQFERVYQDATAAAFPATAAYLEQRNAISGLTASASLDAVDLRTLRIIDEHAHSDSAYATFVSQLCAKLAEVSSSPDTNRYGQFFEIYGEAIVLLQLRSKGIKVKRVPEGNVSMPDFECETKDGRSFFIEVKTFDVVDGNFRQRQMMSDALDTEVELEAQIHAGKQIAMAQREIAPYRRSGNDPDYDPRSLRRVVDTLRKKFRQAFKSSQFAQGPTFALAILDRLVLPGAAQSLAPYYYEPALGGGIVSGVLWQAAFGMTGGQILRLPDFEGKPAIEGNLTEAGIYVDDTQPFGAVGIIVLDVHSSDRVAYGLASPDELTGEWQIDDTTEVLHAFCNAWNDQGHSRAFELTGAT